MWDKDYWLGAEFYSLVCFNQILVLIQDGSYNFIRLLSACKWSWCLHHKETPVNLNFFCILLSKYGLLTTKITNKKKCGSGHFETSLLGRPRAGQLDEFEGFWLHKLNCCFESTEKLDSFQVPRNKHCWIYSTKHSHQSVTNDNWKERLILNIYTTILPIFRIYLMYVSLLTEKMKTTYAFF